MECLQQVQSLSLKPFSEAPSEARQYVESCEECVEFNVRVVIPCRLID